MPKLKGSSELPGSWTLSIVQNSKYKKTQRFGNLISFHPQVKGGDIYPVGPLRKTPAIQTSFFYCLFSC
jgi:hypothetical protein